MKMRKIYVATLTALALFFYGIHNLSANMKIPAKDVSVDTTSFDKNLDSSDNDVQKALETIDEMEVTVVETDPIWGADKDSYYTKVQSDGRYLQSFSELDPVWLAERASYYTKAQSDARYLQSFVETDPQFDTKLATKTTDNLTQGVTNKYANTTKEDHGETAYGWGNHAGLYIPIAPIILDFTDVASDVEFFKDATVGDEVAGKSLIVWRKAVEGNNYAKLYFDASRSLFFDNSGVTSNSIRFGTPADYIAFIPNDGAGSQIFTYAHTRPLAIKSGDITFGDGGVLGRNPKFKMVGWSAEGNAQKYASFQVNDTTNNFELTREDTNIGAFDVQMPLQVNGSAVLTAETDPVAKAINGILKSNGTTLSAATDGSDYLSSSTGLKLDQTTPQTAVGTFTFPTVNFGATTGVSSTAANGVFTLKGLSGDYQRNVNINLSSQYWAYFNTDAVSGFAFQSNIRMNDIISFILGDGNDSRLVWATTGNDSLQLGLVCGSASDSGYFSLLEYSDYNTANRAPSGTSVNPVLRIYSADETQANDYLEFFHDQTDGIINVGSGALRLANFTSNGFVKTSGSNGALSVDTTTYLSAETDPVAKAINGILKSNGSTLSAAVAGTDYLTPAGAAAAYQPLDADLTELGSIYSAATNTFSESIATSNNFTATNTITASDFAKSAYVYSFAPTNRVNLDLAALGQMSNVLRGKTIVSVEYYDGSTWQPWVTNAAAINDGDFSTTFSVDYTHRRFRITFSGFAWQREFAFSSMRSNTGAGTGANAHVLIEKSTDNSTYVEKRYYSASPGWYQVMYLGFSEDGNQYLRVNFDFTPTITEGNTVAFREWIMFSNDPGATLDPIQFSGAIGARSIGSFTAANTLSAGRAIQGNTGGGDYDSYIKGDNDAYAFYLDASTDRVGIGRNDPDHKLDVNGTTRSGNFISSSAVGTAPYACTSTTLNTNLNADLLDGQHAAAFEPALGNPSTSGYVLSSTAAGVRSWIAPPAGAVVDFTTYGAVGDGTTDNTTAMNTALAALYAAGGGTLKIPVGVFRINGQIVIPTDGGTPPSSKPIRITGDGAPTSGYWAGLPDVGSILDLRYASGPKILAEGIGRLEIDHLMLKDGGSDSAPFISLLNTCLMLHDSVISGTASGASAVNDGIIFGGTGWGSGEYFQGYGTTIRDCYFDKLQQVFVLQSAANGILFSGLTISSTCGDATSGAVTISGYSGTDPSGGNIFENILVEGGNYKYFANLIQYCNDNQFKSINFWDLSETSTSVFYNGSSAVNTTIIGGLYYGCPLVTGATWYCTVLDQKNYGLEFPSVKINGYPNSTAASGSVRSLSITPSYLQDAGTSTAANTDIYVNRGGTVGSGIQRLIDLCKSEVTQFNVDSNGNVYSLGKIQSGGPAGAKIDGGDIGAEEGLSVVGTKYGLDFNGTNNSVAVGGTSIAGATTLSGIFDITPDVVDASGCLFQSLAAGGGVGGLEFRINSSGQLELLKTSTASIGTSTGTLTAAKFGTVGFSYNQTTGAYKFYKNGVVIGSGTNAQSCTHGAPVIGSAAGVEWYNGKMSRAQLYGEILTDEQFAADARAKWHGATNTPLFIYRMTEGENATLDDISGNTRDGTIYSAAWVSMEVAGAVSTFGRLGVYDYDSADAKKTFDLYMDGTGKPTFNSGDNTKTLVTKMPLDVAVPETTVAGSTSGNAYFTQPFQGVHYKKVVIRLAALNGTASYTFPTAFSYTPVVVSTNGLATTKVTSLSTTACTVTGATDTGFLIIEGY